MVHISDEKGKTALYHAVEHRRYKMVELILSYELKRSKSINLFTKRFYIFDTLIHAAVKNCDIKMVKLLLSYGESANIIKTIEIWNNSSRSRNESLVLTAINSKSPINDIIAMVKYLMQFEVKWENFYFNRYSYHNDNPDLIKLLSLKKSTFTDGEVIDTANGKFKMIAIKSE